MQTEPAEDEGAGSAGWPIWVRGLRKEFAGGVRVIENMDLEVPAGQFLAILGPSGCGKSTLLRLIAGLDRPNEGQVQVDGMEPGRGGRGDGKSIAYVFQDAHLLPWRNVEQNVALPLELTGVSRQERLGIARGVLEQVGLGEWAGHYPGQLSGGMRMRVSLARALVLQPRLLLLDEPFAALDEITRQHLDEHLRELWAARGMTVVFVTHSISEATFLAERVVVLSRRPARIVADHEVELPTKRTVELRTEAGFAGQMRRLLEALREG